MRLVNNFLSLAGAEVISKLFTLAALVHLARVVGPTGFGYLEFAAAAALCAGLLVDQGFGLYGAREIARDPSSTTRLMGEIVSLRFLLAVLAYGAVAVLSYVVDRPIVVKQLILIYGLSVLFLPLSLQWVFQGHDQMHRVGLLQILRQGVYFAVVVIMVRDALELWPAALAEVAGAGALASASVWMYQRYWGRRLSLAAKPSMRLVREGATIGLSQIFWSMKMYGATVAVGFIANEEDVGFFGGAMRILVGLHAFVWLYFFNLLPSMSRAWNERGGRFEKLFERSFHLMGWLSLGGGLLWVLLAPTVVRLAYGEAFVPAGPVLQYLSGVCVLAAIHGHFRFALIAAKHQQQEMIASAIGAAVAIALIPIGHEHAGLPGAAMALVAGEIAVWVSSAWFCRRYLDSGSHLLDLVLPGVTIGLLASALWWLVPSSVPLLLQAGVAVAALAFAAYLTDTRVRRTFREFVATWTESPGKD